MANPQPHFARGRGRGGRGGRGWHRGYPTPRAADILPAPHASQTLLRTMTSNLLEADLSQTQAYKIKEAQYVASYSWVERNTSTILVPGSPPKWLPPAGKQQLREDSGQYYRDRNAANHPQYPIEPAIRAVYELKPYFDTSQVDFFGCGSTIGSLLHFANGEERTFRFGVERVGTTVFFVRKTNTPTERLEDVRGYGHSFPEAYTVWEPEVKGSASYQRIIRYDFAGFQCMVRSESDGYLPDKLTAVDKAVERHSRREDQSSSEPADDSDLSTGVSLEDAFSGFAQARTFGYATNELSITKAGKPIGQQAIFDLKTRSNKRKDSIELSDFLPRLWANQTPNFILAWHTSGMFGEIDIKDVRSDINRWEHDNQRMLSKFHGVLKALVKFSNEHTRFEVRRNGSRALELWSEVEGWSALPKKLKNRWRSGVADFESDGEEDEDDGKTEIKPEDDDGDANYLRF